MSLKKRHGVTGNYFDLATGDEYWVSGIKKQGTNRHWAGSGKIAVEKNVVYAAPKAPQPKMFEIARRLGLRLLYVPTGSLSRTTLRKIRVMHILASYATRKVARDYLW